ncbi:MAG: HD domain-containing protein [Oscillospiraceae bacterium]|nr:HD domain-containing protein [Oscillospiraceae bacterium]
MEIRTVDEIREEFLDIYKNNITREGSDKLLEYLLSSKSDFFTAPASTRYHSAYEGGLAQHSINVYHCLKAYMERPRVQEVYGLTASDETIAITALLHDLCKVNFYKVDFRNSKNDQGVWEKVPYYTVDDQLPYGHGEKSVYIISGFMKLSREEALAIRYHMGFSGIEDKNSIGKAFEKWPLAFALNTADMEASYFLESR